ncbi:unnamed protein product [Ectocarpus sp. CCAP 1310/34]|nr:unnamed protein product [Ectocarpus sp. CCAP 1310/34]
MPQDLRGLTDATVAESRAASLATSAGFSAAGAETTNEGNNDDDLINRALERVASVDLAIARYTEASAELLSAADRAPEVITHETPRSRARSQGIEVAAVGRVAGAEVRAVELGLGNARLRALAVAGNEESKEEVVDEEVRARRFHLSAENSHFEREVAYENASPHERARREADARLEGTIEGEAEKESANRCHWRAAMADLPRTPQRPHRALAVAGNEESKEEVVDEEVRARRFHLSAENSHFEREVAYENASPHERARREADARLEGTIEGEAEKESANRCHWRAAMADLREIDVRMERLQPIIEAGGEWLRLQHLKDEE